MLLPAAPQDWLPAGHLAHFINDTVDALDLKAFYARYEGGGSRNQPFHPALMVKVLIYAYATGVFSSRKIERRLHEDLAFRMLAAGNFPRHRTICDFRAFHLKELSELFVQVVRLAREMATMAGQMVRKGIRRRWERPGGGTHQRAEAGPGCDEPSQAALRSTSSRQRRPVPRLPNLCRADS